MTEVLKPSDSSQLEDMVKWAIADDIPLEIVGLATKRGLGRPIIGKQGNIGNLVIGHTIDLSSLSGVSLYEPDELVLTAGAGTRVSDIEDLLESEGQQLAFEPLHMAKKEEVSAALLPVTSPDLGVLKQGPQGITFLA